MAKAYEWFDKASLMNCPVANLIIGNYYMYGRHVKKDVTKGLELLSNAHMHAVNFAMTEDFLEPRY